MKTTELVSEHQAAEFLGCPLRELQRLRKNVNGPKHYRLSPKRIMYRFTDLVQWLEARAFSQVESEPSGEVV